MLATFVFTPQNTVSNASLILQFKFVFAVIQHYRLNGKKNRIFFFNQYRERSCFILMQVHLTSGTVDGG